MRNRSIYRTFLKEDAVKVVPAQCARPWKVAKGW